MHEMKKRKCTKTKRGCKGKGEKERDKGVKIKEEERRQRGEGRQHAGCSKSLSPWQWREERALSRFMAACRGNKRMDWIPLNLPIHSVVVHAANIRATLLLLYDDVYSMICYNMQTV